MKNTKIIMTTITRHSDLTLLFFAVLSFIILGIFKTDYYSTLYSVRFNPKFTIILGAAIAVLVEGTRFALMTSSAEDAKNKNWGAFWLGLAASIGILAYDVNLCYSIGQHWSKENLVYVDILQFIAILGGVLEFRICLLMKGEQPQTIQESDKHTPTNQPAVTQQAATQQTATVQPNQKVQPPSPFPFFQSTKNQPLNGVVNGAQNP